MKLGNLPLYPLCCGGDPGWEESVKILDGVIPALLAPFDAYGAVDACSLRKLVGFLLNVGGGQGGYG